MFLKIKIKNVLKLDKSIYLRVGWTLQSITAMKKGDIFDLITI